MKSITYNNVLCDEKYPASDDRTTLEYLEAQGIKVNYHCRDGTCGACRCKLNDGSIIYTTQPLAYIREGEMLPCCSRPTSDIDISSTY